MTKNPKCNWCSTTGDLAEQARCFVALFWTNQRNHAINQSAEIIDRLKYCDESADLVAKLQQVTACVDAKDTLVPVRKTKKAKVAV